MRLRSSLIALSLVLASLPAYAQGGKPGGAGETIASLTAKLTALTDRVAKLEGQIVATDLAGEYRVTGFIAGGNATNPPSVGIGVIYGTATLFADGTGSGHTTLQGTSLVLSNPAQALPIFGEDTEVVTWTYADATLTATNPNSGEVSVFNVAVGGRVMTSAVSTK